MKSDIFFDFFFDHHTGIVYCLYCGKKFYIDEITISHIVKKSARPGMKELNINLIPHCFDCHLDKFEPLCIEDRFDLVKEWSNRWPVLKGRVGILKDLMQGFTLETTGQTCDAQLFLKKCGGKILKADKYLICKKCSREKR